MAFLVDNDGVLVEKYTYDVFGQPKITDPTGTVVRSFSHYTHDFLFQGREYIRQLGVYDYRHRFYHPGLGRFIQTDPIGLQTEGAKLSARQTALYTTGGAPEMFNSSELNLYRYCNSDPVNRSDPFGLDPMVVDQETDVLAHQGLTLNLTAMQDMQWFGGMLFRYEFSTTVLQSPQGKVLSDTVTDRNVRNVEPPSKDGWSRWQRHTITHPRPKTNLRMCTFRGQTYSGEINWAAHSTQSLHSEIARVTAPRTKKRKQKERKRAE